MKIGDRVEFVDPGRYDDRTVGTIVHDLGGGYVVVMWSLALSSTEARESLRPATS